MQKHVFHNGEFVLHGIKVGHCTYSAWCRPDGVVIDAEMTKNSRGRTNGIDIPLTWHKVLDRIREICSQNSGPSTGG